MQHPSFLIGCHFIFLMMMIVTHATATLTAQMQEFLLLGCQYHISVYSIASPGQLPYSILLTTHPSSTRHLLRSPGSLCSIINRPRRSLFTHNWMSMCALTGRQSVCLIKQIWFWLIGVYAKIAGFESWHIVPCWQLWSWYTDLCLTSAVPVEQYATLCPTTHL